VWPSTEHVVPAATLIQNDSGLPQGPLPFFADRLEVRQTACLRCSLAGIMNDAGTGGME
jgi:hypothetical protein